MNLQNTKNPVLLSLIMIVRDEEAMLAQCLESVRDVADEMIIVDTGSTDATVQVAESFGAQVYHHPWQNSFSEAPNYGLPFARGEWLLQLDADEALEKEDIPLLKQLIQSKDVDGYSVVFLNTGPDNAVYRHRNVRLFRNGKIHYEGIVHNMPKINGHVELSSLRIHHYGYNLSPEQMEKKFKRSEALLVRQVKEEPQNTYARANLVRNYRLQKMYDKVISEALAALPIPSIHAYNRQMIYNDLAYAFFKTQQFKQSEEICLKGLQENPWHMDLYYILGGIKVTQNLPGEAIQYFLKYIEVQESGIEAEGLDGLIMDTYGYVGRAWNNIGSCYLNLGKFNKAIDAYGKSIALEKNPQFYRNLIGTYTQLNDVENALSISEQAIENQAADETIQNVYHKLKEIYQNQHA